MRAALLVLLLSACKTDPSALSPGNASEGYRFTQESWSFTGATSPNVYVLRDSVDGRCYATPPDGKFFVVVPCGEP
jgi:hypothetical protein